jgi:transposase
MGKFSGLTNAQWNVVENHVAFRIYVRGKGQPPIHPRQALNSICWILITGARWCDIPQGPQWGSRTASHRWLGVWQENGIWETLLTALQETGVICGVMDLERLAVDGFFSAGKGGGEGIAYGYKGKGTTSHVLVDGKGSPLRISTTSAGGDERGEVMPLLKKNRAMDSARANPGVRSRQRVRLDGVEDRCFIDDGLSHDSVSTNGFKDKKRHQPHREKKVDGREGHSMVAKKIPAHLC